MRDWSSDVCSSDLRRPDRAAGNPGLNRTPLAQFHDFRVDLGAHHVFEQTAVAHALDGTVQFESAGRTGTLVPEIACATRSGERRVGKECVSQCRSRRRPYNKTNKTT